MLRLVPKIKGKFGKVRKSLSFVESTERLPDGTVKTVYKSGTVYLVKPVEYQQMKLPGF